MPVKCVTVCTIVRMGYLDQWSDDGRICTRCGTFKPWEEFHARQHGKNGRASICAECGRVARRQYRADNLERVRATDRAYEQRIGRHTKRRYGLGREEWEAQVAAQGGLCAVCGRKPRRRLVGDHCHLTGTFRGIVCDQCNIAMGQTGDDPEILRALADWIELERQAHAS